jgi:hypothetical protein
VPMQENILPGRGPFVKEIRRGRDDVDIARRARLTLSPAP